MLLPVVLATLFTLLIAIVLATTARIHAMLPANRRAPSRRRTSIPFLPSPSRSPRSRRLEKASRDAGSPISSQHPYQHIMIVLGSGGHTAEMLLMLEPAGLQRWKRRSWVVSSGDRFSAGLAAEFETRLARWSKESGCGDFDIINLPRARRVHQSLLSAPWSSLRCLWAAVKMLMRGASDGRGAPDIILTNGPATGVIVVLANLTLRFFNLAGSSKTRVIYVESLARCRKLSLSGRLLKVLVDRFLVQWADLASGGSGVEFRGCFSLDAAAHIGTDDVGGTEVASSAFKTWIELDI